MPTAINLFAVLVAAIVSMVVGGLWYSPILFGKMWMSLSGMTAESMAAAKAKGVTMLYGIQFLFSLIGAYVLAYFISMLQVSTAAGAVTLAFWLWLGFELPLLVGSVIWEGKSKKLFVLNSLQYLIALAAMGIAIVFI